MVKTSFVACMSLFVFLGACKQDAPASPTAPVSPTAARRAPIPPPPMLPARAVGPAPAELTALLTEDKVAHFATYQKEMLAATADATGLGLAFTINGSKITYGAFLDAVLPHVQFDFAAG